MEENSYGRGAVYSSLAYDFNHPELYGEEYSAPLEQPEEETRTQTVTRTLPQVHTRQGIAPFSIIGLFIAAFLLVTGITAQVQLFSISGDSVALEAELRELEMEQARLRIAHESAFNLAEIEEYATGVLGMRKPTADQIAYIDTASPDRAVVLGQEEQDSFLDRAADVLAGIGSYFQWGAE